MRSVALKEEAPHMWELRGFGFCRNILECQERMLGRGHVELCCHFKALGICPACDVKWKLEVFQLEWNRWIQGSWIKHHHRFVLWVCRQIVSCYWYICFIEKVTLHRTRWLSLKIVQINLSMSKSLLPYLCYKLGIDCSHEIWWQHLDFSLAN